MSDREVHNGRDAWVNSASPSQGHPDGKRLRIVSPGTKTEWAYIWFRNPAPKGATILSAHLHLFGAGADGVAATITVQRLSQRWSVSGINWNNTPAVVGGTASVNVTQDADAKEYVFDVSAQMQTVTDSGTFYGLRISTSSLTERVFYSLDATDNRPYLEVEWSDAPDVPINLLPSGGSSVSLLHPVLSYDYYDPNGSDLDQQQVQVKATNTGWTSDAGFAVPDFDSGVLATDDPELDTSTTAWAGITAGASVFWTVRVRNAAGRWSDWADPRSFTRVNKVTVAFDNPSAAAPVVHDATPEYAWTVTGGTQVARRVITRMVSNADNTADPADDLDDTGRRHTTDTTYTPGRGVITDESATYEIELRTFDDDTRQRTPGDPVYIQTVQQFTYVDDNTIGKVTGLAAAQDPAGRPAVDLTWTDATFPDGYTIRRQANGGAWRFLDHNIDPAELFVSGTSFAYTDWTAVPNVDYEYKVSRRVNGHLGPGDAVAFTYQADELWLTDVDTGRNVPLLITDRTQGATGLVKPDLVGTYRTLSGLVVQIFQGQSGLEGDVSALLVDYAGSAAGHWLANLMWMKARPDNRLRFVFGGRNLHVTLTNLTDEPVPGGKADWRIVTFHFTSHDGPTG